MPTAMSRVYSGTAAILRKVTKNEIERQVTQANFRRMTSNVPGMIFQLLVTQKNERLFEYASDGCLEIFDEPASALMADPAIFFNCIKAHDSQSFYDSLREAGETLSPWKWIGEIELKGERKDRWIQISSRPRRLPNGDLVWEGIATDVSHQQSLERQLIHAQKMESIGQLAAGVAHEINTPTQYIGDNTHFLKGAAKRLKQAIELYSSYTATDKNCPIEISGLYDEYKLSYLLEEIPTALEQTGEGVQQIMRIVGAMKQLSHPEMEEMVLFDVNRGLASTIDVARNEWKYVANIETYFDPNLPLIRCIPGMLGQVWLNVLINAAHAIESCIGSNPLDKGLITVRTETLENHIQVSISDTGGGIPEKLKKLIFEPFFTTKEIGRGTGQGLAIVHTAVIDKHHGSIDIVSTEGAGTRFIVTLPVEQRTA